MSNPVNSLRNWLRQEILQVLKHPATQPPLLVWCDPERIWPELLQAAAEGNTFELWAEDGHELLLRERFFHAPPAARVVWLPVGRDEIAYFKVFALRAEAVWQPSLPEVLARYGVDLPMEQLHDLKPLLPAHAKEWLDYPLAYWKEHLSPAQVKTSLIDDDLFLQILASTGQPLDHFIGPDRLPILNRRAVEDFGLPPLLDPTLSSPDPAGVDIDSWRLQALAALLVSDALVKSPALPPGDRDRLIPAGPARENALKLLTRWQKQVDLMDGFETLAPQADKLTTLQYWARNLEVMPLPLASPQAEAALFQAEVERLAGLDRFGAVAELLETNSTLYRQHARGFWGERAREKVRWERLVELAEIAGLLHQQAGVEQSWHKPDQAVSWFTGLGWQVDQAGERLFKEDHHDLPGGLVGVRAKLRRAYLFHLNQVNQAFSELLAHADADGRLPLALPCAGDTIKAAVAKASPKNPVAVIFLDACRYDLGQRLAGLLNQGEPVRRAEVTAARAPLPSITPLGMSYALPGAAAGLHVELTGKSPADWRVTVDGFQGNLATAADRRRWLQETYKLTEASFLSIEDIVDSDRPEKMNTKTLGRLVVVSEATLDDHDQVFPPFGLDQVVTRYAALVRRLRAGGYNTIFVVTDHGFFHWDPDPDEKDLPRPDGAVLWQSRRAIVGRDLKHPSALKFQVSGSDDLECCVPRSVNAFRTYGGLGFFHGGVTLQEMVTPVIAVAWPEKAQKTGVVLKPIEQITSLAQRVEIVPAAIQKDLFGQVSETLLSRQVLLKVVHPQTGKWFFKSEAAKVEPGGASITLELVKNDEATANRGTTLELRVIDADDEEILDHRPVTLLVDMDEWL